MDAQDDFCLHDYAQENPDDFRESLRALLRVLHYTIEKMDDFVAPIETQIDGSKRRVPKPNIYKWGAAFATGCHICNGKSISEVAAFFQVSRAAISFAAKKYCEDTGLPPSNYMRSEQASKIAKTARMKAVKRISNQKKH